MIISASRRTDIPSHYSEWFFRRLEAGFVCTRNPMNPPSDQPRFPKNLQAHDPASPLLCGTITPEDTVRDRKMESCEVEQLGLHDLIKELEE